jgi:type IV pilus assembly protein PilA
VELLVVILIVAILASIAIPVFLKQREDGYRAQLESALKNTAVALESYATEHSGDYSAAALPQLRADHGLNLPALVDVTLPPAHLTSSGYCIEASHPRLAEIRHFSKSAGQPASGAC